MTQVDQQCGCKGVRHCALCVDSQRVRLLNNSSPTVASKFDLAAHELHIVCHGCMEAYPVEDVDRLLYEDEHYIARIAQMPCSSHADKIGVRVAGLHLFVDMLTEEEETDIVQRIDRKEWALSQSGRRKQDYGPKVNFKKRKVRCAEFVGIPDYGHEMLRRMENYPILRDYVPFELCNLEYQHRRLSSIDYHRDDVWIWGNRLISTNLLAGGVMSFKPDGADASNIMLLLYMPRRSLLCMKDDWHHGLLAMHCTSERRIALTMRECAKEFAPGGRLHEQFGRLLIERSQVVISTG